MAKILRNWKRKNKIHKKILTVCSNEVPGPVEVGAPLPSAIFVPASAGLIMASRCVADLAKKPTALHTMMAMNSTNTKSTDSITLEESQTKYTPSGLNSTILTTGLNKK